MVGPGIDVCIDVCVSEGVEDLAIGGWIEHSYTGARHGVAEGWTFTCPGIVAIRLVGIVLAIILIIELTRWKHV